MILDHFPVLTPFNPEDSQLVLDAAKADGGHGVFLPTDVVMKNGEIVGAISMGSVPLIMAWMHSTKVSPRDTLQIWQTVEGVQRRLGVPGIVIPCQKTSPFHPVMERMAYLNLGTYDLFYK